MITDSLPTSVETKYDYAEHDNSVYFAVQTYPDKEIEVYKCSGTEKTKLGSTNVQGGEPSLFFIDGIPYISYRPENSYAVKIISYKNNCWEKFSDPEVEGGVSSEYHCIADSIDHTIYIVYSDSEHNPYVKIHQNGKWANVGKGSVKKYQTGNWLRNMRLVMMQGIPYLILNMCGKIYLLSVK